jgi:hypothetical protein
LEGDESQVVEKIGEGSPLPEKSVPLVGGDKSVIGEVDQKFYNLLQGLFFVEVVDRPLREESLFEGFVRDAITLPEFSFPKDSS